MAGRGPFSPIPPGWRECPPMGEISKDYNLIPMKVPLGHTQKCPHMLQLTGGHWTPEEALETAYEKVQAENPQGVVGMVLDLTNSNKYYDPYEFTSRNVRYCKVPCRGRGESPDPLAVNMAVWEMRKSLAAQPNLYILVHCTHGFNRSGFVIISAAMRLLAERGWCVERLFRRFAAQRPPGIYKHQYITDLFKRHNEHRPQVAVTPPLPIWKPADDDEDDGQLLATAQQPAPARLTHSDKVGEPIPMEEARWVLNVVYDTIAGQDAYLSGRPVEGFPHYAVQQKAPSASVIGSQPVSLDRENLELLRRKRFFVTWKADGTRYLILILKYGTYLIDRSGEVRRVHMRFPSLKPPQAKKPGEYPLGPPHDFTLLDGEMVVDDVALDGSQQRRRLLIYDVMMLGGEGVSDLRFADRFYLIDKELCRPRKEEQDYHMKHTKAMPMWRYDWGWEAFSVRRKEFWPLDKARTLLENFIPTLCHESDGLILQPYDDPYIPRTYPHLLKWKFPHMNSVDFKLLAMPGRTPALQLNCGFRRKYGSAETNHLTLGDCGLGEQKVEFPDDIDPLKYHGKIIECSFDMERRVWVYMRERTDKDTANHRSVFDKVMTSITDNITEEELLRVFDDALKLPIYKEEQMWRDGTHPSQLAQTRPQQQQQPQQLPQQHQQQLAQAAAAGPAGPAAPAGRPPDDDGGGVGGDGTQQQQQQAPDFGGDGAAANGAGGEHHHHHHQHHQHQHHHPDSGGAELSEEVVDDGEDGAAEEEDGVDDGMEVEEEVYNVTEEAF